MKIICHSDCVYNADGQCAKPDDAVLMLWTSREDMEGSDFNEVICDDYLKGEADETKNETKMDK